MGILGWEQEIMPMNVGGKRKLQIPSVLAYGASGLGPIPANQDLTFEIEILEAFEDNTVASEVRLGGYFLAVSIPLLILFVAFNLVQGNF